MARGTQQSRATRRGRPATVSQRGTRPEPSKRYTPPIPREVRRSPRWYPWVLLGALIVGILVIIGNYASFLPASPSNWYTLGGLIAILGAAIAATYYR